MGLAVGDGTGSKVGVGTGSVVGNAFGSCVGAGIGSCVGSGKGGLVGAGSGVGRKIVGEGTVAVSVRIMRKVAMTRIVGCILMYLVRSPATDKSFARYLGLSCSCLVAVLCEQLGIVDNR